MKCFKTFFKHTWHPQQMMAMSSFKSTWDVDFPCFDPVEMINTVHRPTSIPEEEFLPQKNRISDPHMNNNSSVSKASKENIHDTNEMELKEVDVIVPTKNVATLTVVQPGSIPCQNGGCKNWGSRGVPESPWHILKTIFLISVIVTLIIWILIYTLLATYQIF